MRPISVKFALIAVSASLFPSVLLHCWLGDRKGCNQVMHWAISVSAYRPIPVADSDI